jgi:glycosyltransferase involved in cell wall biosynthesis
VNIAYLMNAYPMTSTTFVRREIEALESVGLPIRRYAVRTWSSPLVDPRDVAEQQRTCYLLTGNIFGLITAFGREAFFNPVGMMRALREWIGLLRKAGAATVVKHVAYLMQAAHFRQLATAEGIDHVHAHFGTNATAVALLSRRLGGPSYSFTVHGPYEFVDVGKLSFETKIANAEFVVAISDYCRNELLRVAPLQFGKIVVGRCAIAVEDFLEPERRESDADTLVCVGRLCPQKGQVLIPEAAAKLRDEFPSLKIVLVGDGESRADVEAAIADHDASDVVELRGWLTNAEVLELVKKCRALLLPSYAEGLPVVLMEALALGRPVISTTIAGIPELVDEKCGWLFAPGDRQGLVSAMRAALKCSSWELSEMGAAGRERVLRLHDRRDLAKFLYDRFRRVVDSRQGTGLPAPVQPGSAVLDDVK